MRNQRFLTLALLVGLTISSGPSFAHTNVAPLPLSLVERKVVEGLGSMPELLPTSDPTCAPTQTITTTQTLTFASPLAPVSPLAQPLNYGDVLTWIWDFGKTIVAGIIGAYLVHILDYKRFRKEEKYRDEQKKRDALKDILERQQSMLQVLHIAPVKKDDRDWQQRRTEIWQDIDKVRPLFYSNKEVYDALSRLGGLFRLLDVRPRLPGIPSEFDEFEEYIGVLKNELITLNKSLAK